ncbi:hypothetical protein ECZU25_29370 [Escherichia coli]|nr:hypothetical protein ECZU25_29370 [Escherichia coli]
MINGDSHNTAIAIIMRCNMPPLISNGYSFNTRAAFSNPTASKAAVSVASSAGFPNAAGFPRVGVHGVKRIKGAARVLHDGGNFDAAQGAGRNRFAIG